MTICYKRRDEFIGILQSWYQMDWSKYFDLADLQVIMTETFEVKILLNSIFHV
jgi:hypothetical protein